MIDIDKVRPAPWDRYDWSGELVSADGCPTTDFTQDDVAEVLQFASTGDEWDGNTAGVARLKDGRFIAWEAFYGPTGSGFSMDAYGSNSDIVFAHTPSARRCRTCRRRRAISFGTPDKASFR